MKAAICYEAGKPLVIEEINIQPPQNDEIRVKVRSIVIPKFGLFNFHYVLTYQAHLKFF